jgi:hypothetical protein
MSIRHGPDDEAATEISHSSTIQVDNCTAQDSARVQYGHTYVQNQYNGFNAGFQQHSGNTNQRTDFVKSLAFGNMNFRYESIDPAHINTCQWLFQKPEYLQWRDTEHLASHSGFLWIKGKAGSGKSTLMKRAFEHAKKSFHNDKVIAFFFNARGQPLERSVEGMYRSLLSQILRRFPGIRSRFPTYGPEPGQQQGWAVPVLRNHLYRAVTSLGQGEAMTLYIDALDECDEDDIREAIEHFEELGSAVLSMPISLHICFASRYYPRVSIQHCIEILLEEQAGHEQDIKEYINDKLAIRDIAFKAQLTSKIEARASGVFFWVVLVVRMMRERCDGGASRSAVLKSLQEVPDKLQELIGAILHSPDDALLCAMQWMMFGRRSLKLPELYSAIHAGTGQTTSGAWDTPQAEHDGMEAFILASSRGLVEVKSDTWSTDMAHLVHESVRVYLMNGGLKGLGRCSDKLVEANNHAKLFERCQTYLKSITISKADGSGLHNPHERPRTYPLMRYIHGCILHHFEVSHAAGVLRLSSLCEFPVEQYVQTLWGYDDTFRRDYCLQQQLELHKPRHRFVSLLYISLAAGCVQLAGALLAEIAVHPPDLDDQNCTSGTVGNTGLITAKILNMQFVGFSQNLLELAVGRCPSLVCSLLDHGADPNSNKGAALQKAVIYCTAEDDGEDTVRVLLSRGADIHIFSMYNTTVLTTAVATGLLPIVTLLLEHDADANDYYASTAVSPLLAALGHSVPNVELWHTDEKFKRDSYDSDTCILRVLLDHGADVYLRAGPKQNSPLQYATEKFTGAYGGGDIIRLLTSYGQRNVPGTDLSLAPAAREMDEEVER